MIYASLSRREFFWLLWFIAWPEFIQLNQYSLYLQCTTGQQFVISDNIKSLYSEMTNFPHVSPVRIATKNTFASNTFWTSANSSGNDQNHLIHRSNTQSWCVYLLTVSFDRSTIFVSAPWLCLHRCICVEVNLYTLRYVCLYKTEEIERCIIMPRIASIHFGIRHQSNSGQVSVFVNATLVSSTVAFQ